jgi:hypothetical protein
MNNQLQQLIHFSLKLKLFRCFCHKQLFYEEPPDLRL